MRTTVLIRVLVASVATASLSLLSGCYHRDRREVRHEDHPIVVVHDDHHDDHHEEHHDDR